MSLQRYLISLTRPARYAVESLSYRMFGDTTKLAELRNSNQGKPMLVVGNGPSLNRTPLDEFAGVPSIGMNKIDMIFPRTAWRPTLIVCLNNIVAQQHQDSFAASEIPVLVAWKARRLIRSGNRQRLTYFETKSKNAFSTDLMRGFGGSATVTYIALQLAYWSGADPVVLLGVDHSFKFSGPRATYQKRSGPDENHFDPNYFKSGTVWGTPDLVQSEIDYQLARDAFESGGRRIFDATVDGKLEVFDKISIERALELTRLGANA